MKPLRVVYFVSLFPCWSETFIVREIDALIARGIDVRIVSLRPPSEALVQEDARALAARAHHPPALPAQLAIAAIEAMRAPLATGAALAEAVRALWRRPVEAIKTVGALVRTLSVMPVLRRLAPDHLHAHWATYPSTAAMFASRRLAVPFSFTAHAHDLFRHDHLLARKVERAAFSVVISEFNRRFLRERVGPVAEQAPVRVVHCGLPTAFVPFRPVTPGPAGCRLVSVGRLDPIKGFEHLVDACAELRRRGRPVDTVIVGDGPLRGALQARIDAAGLGDRVRLAGAQPQPQVQQALADADVFVLPSVVTPEGDRDGIPVALMEAMARGVPVVSTTVSGIPELVGDRREGRLVPPGDAVALADAIEEQLDDRVQAARMALAARERVERCFDVQVEAAHLGDAFAAAVAAAGAGERRQRGWRLAPARPRIAVRPAVRADGSPR